jgi:hypothetical protein
MAKASRDPYFESREVKRQSLIPRQAQINCKRSKKVLEMLQKTVYYES